MPATISPKRRPIVDELTLQDGGDLEALGHDVEGDDALGVGIGEDPLQLRQFVGSQNPRLVREHMQPRLD